MNDLAIKAAGLLNEAIACAPPAHASAEGDHTVVLAGIGYALLAIYDELEGSRLAGN